MLVTRERCCTLDGVDTVDEGVAAAAAEDSSSQPTALLPNPVSII